jgi:hypothetical protein
LFGSLVATIIVGAFATIHPVLIFYSNMRLTETLFSFLLIAALLALYHKQWFWGSVLLVLGILTRPAVDFIAPAIILIFSLIVHREQISARLIAGRIGTYAVVYVMLMSPLWIHNYNIYGQFVRLNLGDGVVLRLENNSSFDKVGLDFVALGPMLAEFDALGDPVAINEARKKAAVAYILSNPLHFLSRCVERVGRFWTPIPGSPRPLINLLAVVATLPIFLGAMISVMCGRRRLWRQASPILLIILYLTALHGVSHALPRYRLPLEPLLIALAAGWYGRMVEALYGRWSGRDGARHEAGTVPGGSGKIPHTEGC